MEYIYAALLLHEAKKEISEKEISGIVKAAGIEANEAMVKATVENLKDINIEEVLNTAMAAPVAVAAAPTAGAAGAETKEEKKPEDEEKKKEEAAAGLSSLFG
ncbi:MAG: 50S ribosomal protein P1 [Candidatus Aenigmarchaeota archaeon]|nr:50S ribosomal protein P1 [Candidatus Aenigmarchaeota archaeon]